jgi:hypothetical protein
MGPKANVNRHRQLVLTMDLHIAEDVALAVVHPPPSLVRVNGFPHVEQQGNLMINYKIEGRHPSALGMFPPEFGVLRG